jgi:ketosteroid isomerase-like protein
MKSVGFALRAVLLSIAVAAVGMAVGGMLRSPEPAVAQANPDAIATDGLTRFYDALSGKGNLADVLGDAFQVMRTDGTRIDRATYLSRHPSYRSYRLSDIRAAISGDTLTVSFLVGARGTIEEREIDSTGEPRLAVFGREGGAWKLQAIANLGTGLVSAAETAGRRAVEAWVGAVVSGDREKVKAVLAPEFQIVRSDGTAYDAEAYLQSDLPVFPSMPEIRDLVVTGFGDYLVARYVLPVGPRLGSQTELAEGPRLTVFRKRGDTWLVVAHANFAAIVR